MRQAIQRLKRWSKRHDEEGKGYGLIHTPATMRVAEAGQYSGVVALINIVGDYSCCPTVASAAVKIEMSSAPHRFNKAAIALM